MAIKTTKSGMVITGRHVEIVQLLLIIRMLKFEVLTGISSGTNPTAAGKAFLKAAGHVPERKKAELLAQLEALDCLS